MTLDKRFCNPQAPDRQAHAVLACQQPSPDKSGSYANRPEPGHPVACSLSSANAADTNKDKSVSRITSSFRSYKSRHPVGARFIGR